MSGAGDQAVRLPGEEGALTVEDFCWLFTALGHGGLLDEPSSWVVHEPTARKAVWLLADRWERLDREARIESSWSAITRAREGDQ